jgi:molybdopterin-guanine dinucleotide biosynthesis protein A
MYLGSMNKVTSIILAGGKNLRLGRNKALEAIDGKTLIERVIERLRPLSNRMLIVIAQGNSDLPVFGDEEVVTDISPGYGPLGGIYTGLLASSSPNNIVVACDMPFLNTGLLRYMLEISGGYDAVIPRLDDGKVEPLHAIYSKSCLDYMKKQMDLNQLKVHSLLKKVRVRYIEGDESRRLDPQLLSFFNVNHQSDLDRAIALAESEQVTEK